MKFDKRVAKVRDYILGKLKNKTLGRFLISVLISLFQFLYIFIRYEYINPEVPFWLTKLWGDSQLAPKENLYLIPIMSLSLSVAALVLDLLNKFYIRYIKEVIWFSVIFCNTILLYSVFTIVQSASKAFKPLINPLYISLIPPFIAGFVLIYILMPVFISYAQRRKIVTDPKIHQHPGMVLDFPSARGGGFVYGIVFLLISVIFVGLSENFIGLYLSVLMLSVLGIMDDFQNTHPTSGLGFLENPILRLFLVFLSVLPVIFSGALITTVSNPFGGMIDLDVISLTFKGSRLPVVPIVVTTVWVVWFMNVLSWSNGIDGQYAGIVGIASILVALLALRFKVIEPYHVSVATLAAISAGASFGSVRFNWYPSKIMWGFGALTAGLIIASLAILARAKITVSVLIILVPFLDAVVTVARRILNGKSPFRGDKGHFHHVLLNRGWGIRRIALFYWYATAIFGLIGLLSPENQVFKVGSVIAGAVAFIIILLNVQVLKKRSPS